MVHGKQIKDSSIGLVKVNPASGQLLTLVGTSKIQVNAAPTVGIDLVNKDYVDALVTGLDFKESVRVASNGTNIVIATAPAAIDGVTLTGGNRVLLKDQTLPAQNGIYIFNGTGNAMTRSTDADTNIEVTAGMFMFVEEGTWADTGWVLSTNNPIVLGTTGLTFTQFSSAGVITASNGLTKTGNDIKLGGALTANTNITGAFDLELGTTGSKLNTLRGNATSQISFQSDANVSLEGLNGMKTYVNAGTSAYQEYDDGLTFMMNGITTNTVVLAASDYTNNIEFKLYTVPQTVTNNGTNNNGVITDTISSKGLVYATDYSANFTLESLITKRYVDVAITALTNAAGGINTVANKLMVASTTTASGQQIAAAIAAAPKNDSYVQVFVNGVKCTVGNGVGTTDVYFADPLALGTPKAIAAITAGDVLVRGTGLGYDTDATDVVEYDYQA